MLHFLDNQYIENHTLLSQTMFRDRAAQFRGRLGWDVKVDERGFEKDEYDDKDSTYIVLEQDDGRHAGSIRLRPMVKPTMLVDHFSHLADVTPFQRMDTWECTRFCLSPNAPYRTANLLLAGIEAFTLSRNVHALVAVYDKRVQRVYRRLGVAPLVLGQSALGPEQVFVGVWSKADMIYANRPLGRVAA